MRTEPKRVNPSKRISEVPSIGATLLLASHIDDSELQHLAKGVRFIPLSTSDKDRVFGTWVLSLFMIEDADAFMGQPKVC